MSWEFGYSNRSWTNKDHTERRCYREIRGRALIPELIAAFEAEGVDWSRVELSGSAVWTEPPTADEIAAQADLTARQAARAEGWERETLVRLTKKYGPVEVSEGGAE